MSALDELLPFLADGYRRELEQTETIWGTLSFFAATLALQVGGLAQLVGRMDELTGWEVPAGFFLLTMVGVFSAGALWFTALAVAPTDYEYLASEPSLRDFARELDHAAALSNGSMERPTRAFKELLASQYAQAIAFNRRKNQVQRRTRGIAALLTLLSVLAALLLIGLIVGRHLLPLR